MEDKRKQPGFLTVKEPLAKPTVIRLGDSSYEGSSGPLWGYPYDAASNLLNDGQNNYIYDAENRVCKFDHGSHLRFIDVATPRGSSWSPADLPKSRRS